jgi:hypothetical protein
MESNPFAILTFIAAPAVLTNASSVLALGTSNRFGRNVDRARQLIKLLETSRSAVAPTDETRAEQALNRKLLGWMEYRTALLMRALSLFYFAIGAFAAGSLTSLLGAILASSTDHPQALEVVLIVALIAGTGGLCGLICGGWLLVRETRLALRTIREEMNFYRDRYQSPA